MYENAFYSLVYKELEFKDLQERHSKQMYYQLIKIKKHLILSSHFRKF